MAEDESAQLERLDYALRWMAEADTVSELKGVVDFAETMRYHASRVGLGLKAQNRAAEIKVRAQRKAGELLTPMPKNEGGLERVRSSATTALVPEPATLAELGITKDQSSIWQRIAAIPPEVFEAHIAETKDAGDELTSAGVVRLAKALGRRTEPAPVLDAVPLPERRYRCLVIDPPWPIEKIEREERPAQAAWLDYPTMTLDEIAELPIADLAGDDGCHVYLWVTQRFLPAGLSLFAAWGVRYECVLTWLKPGGMTPFSWMYNTEHVIFGRLGQLPLQRLGLKLGFSAPATGHSVKPDAFYQRVLEASPAPRLELFARRSRDGFDVWGNEVADAVEG